MRKSATHRRSAGREGEETNDVFFIHSHPNTNPSVVMNQTNPNRKVTIGEEEERQKRTKTKKGEEKKKRKKEEKMGEGKTWNKQLTAS